MKRRTSRCNLYEFAKYVFPKFKESKHIEKICKELEDIEAGKNTRLIISCPPQHGKSTIVDTIYIPWYLGKHPSNKVVLSSYSQKMADYQARRTNDIFYSSKYSKIFPNVAPYENNKDYKNTDQEFETLKRGSVYSVGIGGSLTGRGYDLGIVDDYVAGREEANSESAKVKIMDWWRSTFLTRQSPVARIVVIATRWAQDDLIGTLIKEEGDIWRVISLPAIDINGEALWEGRYNKQKLAEIKKSMGSHEWSALYLGEPTIAGGNRFKTGLIKIHQNINDFPQGVYIRAWDLASSSKERNSQDPDYTVGVLGAIIKSNGIPHLWIKDIVCGRWDAPERDTIIKGTANQDGGSVIHYIESYGAYKDAYTTLRKALMGRNIVRNSIMPGDKVVKASILEPIFEAGNVHLLKGRHNDMFIKQFSEFPFGRHDDFVDATSIVANECTRTKSGILIT